MSLMKTSPAEQEAIVKMLTRIYIDIRDIEEEFQLLVGDHDFRPRIEYFHDAIRAFTAQDPKHPVTGGRLSVELLAYDLSCLRYLESMPLASFKPHGAMLSPQTAMAAVKPGLVAKKAKPDSTVRGRISELYRHYAVLFAALLKPFADRDYRDRTEEMNEQVEALHALMQQMEALGQGKGSQAQAATTIQHLGEEGLRHEMLKFMHNQQFKKKDALAKLTKFLKDHAAKTDKELAAVDAAHLNYAMSQLAVYEGARDMLKNLAGQGMNLVGQFVENAMKQTQREMGR